MIAVRTALLAILIMLFCSNALAAIGSFLCNDDERFRCYTVKRGDSWQKLFKDPDQRELVMRLNRMNVPIYRGMKIAIPKDLENADIMDFAPFPHQIDPPGEKTIFVSINPKVLAWGAYDSDGSLQAWGPVSGGRGWCPDIHHSCNTALGKFSVYRSGGSDCKSTKFPVPRGGAPMPYCMYFHGGFALHGSYDVPGYNASHGCIRMLVPDAKWLNQEFVTGDDVPVIVSNQT